MKGAARRIVLGVTGAIALVVAGSAVEAQVTSPPRRLCPDDPRTSSSDLVPNEEKRTVRDILGIAPSAVEIQYRSPDWTGAEAIAERIREILGARPRFLSQILNWSEGADLQHTAFVATVRLPDGAPVRMDVAGYQVCIRDATGKYWYFRMVDVDQWPR